MRMQGSLFAFSSPGKSEKLKKKVPRRWGFNFCRALPFINHCPYYVVYVFLSSSCVSHRHVYMRPWNYPFFHQLGCLYIENLNWRGALCSIHLSYGYPTLPSLMICWIIAALSHSVALSFECAAPSLSPFPKPPRSQRLGCICICSASELFFFSCW